MKLRPLAIGLGVGLAFAAAVALAQFSGTGAQVIVENSVSVLQGGTWAVQGAETAGSAVTGGLERNGGSDGANARDLRTDPSGHLVVGLTLPGTPITATSGNIVNNVAVATLAGTSGKTTYITGFQCTSSGATAGLVGDIAVANTISGSLFYVVAFPASTTTLATPIIVDFGHGVPASAANTAITVTMPAAGSGNTDEVCNAEGYQL